MQEDRQEKAEAAQWHDCPQARGERYKSDQQLPKIYIRGQQSSLSSPY